jgi:phage baseplate assembly protein V
MREMLNRVAGRVRLMVGRCILQGIDDTTKMQSVQVMVREGEVRDKCEHFQHYGFTSVPHPGAEGIGLAVGGSTDHMVVICLDDRRYRLKGLQEGEVALYTDEGDSIVFKRGRIIEVTAGTKVVFNTPLVEMTGELHVVGDVIGEGKSLPHHTHREQGDGEPTSPPL